MQKKIIALAVAGLSTAAFAQTNVTIYGVADVSAQGYNMSQSNGANQKPSGGSFNLTNNSSLIGFKGTEALGNGLNALFQVETNVNIAGNSNNTLGGGVNSNTQAFNSLRDSYVGLNSKYGTVLGGYLSTPFRSALNSFDVMPGATGVGRIENLMGTMRFGDRPGNTGGTGYVQGASSVRATALAYALPTLYGFNGSIAYTGSNNNGGSNQTSITEGTNTATNLVPQSALSMNLGWSGYGVDIKGAFQQAKINNTTAASTSIAADGTVTNTAASNNSYQAYTSYLIGAAYTGVPGLKAAVVYNRNTLSTNAMSGTEGAAKGSNNQIWVGASYRFGNNEPRLSYVNSSNTSGFDAGQDGGRQITANWGYYLSKRTQVYGIISQIKNNANGVWNFAGTGSNLAPTGGQNLLTYGAGLRTNF